ncbi:SH3 domain-containing protein [Leptospira santarosai]|uniref:SH3 domain-containing protein n=1 Tax=Leptospira santarosai TaxID=28183 RepID=UPI0024AF4825|nr:SH3 domain-containing protein [Leptospira santarosai]MDI7208587.1 SH3 domain-containing protein [Leptospira santarosai]
MKIIKIVCILFLLNCLAKPESELHGIVRGNVVNIRSNGAFSSEKKGVIKYGENLKILEQSKNKEAVEGFTNYWYRFENSSKSQGWIYGSFVTLYENRIPTEEMFIDMFRRKMGNPFPLIRISKNQYTRFESNYNDYGIDISVEKGILTLHELEKHDFSEQKTISVYIMRDDQLFMIYRGWYPGFHYIEANCFINIDAYGLKTYNMEKVIDINIVAYPGSAFEQTDALTYSKNDKKHIYEYDLDTGLIFYKDKSINLILKKYRLLNCKVSELAATSNGI